jgi:signal transduction histidine kinase
VLRSGSVRVVAAGEVIFRQGDAGDRLYVVLSGTFRISTADDFELNTIGPGGFVGEIALLDGGPRSATVSCVESGEMFALSRSAFVQLLQTSPALLSSVLENLTRMVRNATELAAQQRIARLEMEAARLRALTEMVAGVAHEINTPLGIVRTAASVLSNRLAAGSLDDAAEASSLIDRNVERAHRLVEEFKKLSVSQVSDTRESLDLVSVVEEVVELFSITARAGGLQVSVIDVLVGDRSWVGYRGRLSQVLLNLLSNVQRYAYPGSPGGKVEIAIALDASDRFVISVQDFGRGIAPDDLPHVMDPFFTTGRGQGGSGLGLAIVHNLVHDALGGTVAINSQLGVGTTVTLSLPRTAPET